MNEPVIKLADMTEKVYAIKNASYNTRKQLT